MGNCCRGPHEKRSEFEDEELILGDSPGVPPAVLLNVCYWDTSQPTTGGASIEEEVEEAGLNFDKIIIALKDKTGLLSQVYVHKEEGYCKRLCDDTNTPKSVVQVTVNEESGSGWSGSYVDSLRAALEEEWDKDHFFIQVIDKASKETKKLE